MKTFWRCELGNIVLLFNQNIQAGTTKWYWNAAYCPWIDYFVSEKRKLQSNSSSWFQASVVNPNHQMLQSCELSQGKCQFGINEWYSRISYLWFSYWTLFCTIHVMIINLGLKFCKDSRCILSYCSDCDTSPTNCN
jgi:hypothetical protein